MRKTKKKFLAVFVAVLGLLGTTTPASATTWVNVPGVVFEVDISGGVGFVTSVPATSAITIGANLACAAQFTGKLVAFGDCNISGGGFAVGICGQLTGELWGSITLRDVLSGSAVSATFHLEFQGAGSAFVATGSVSIGGQTGVITVFGSFLPRVSSVGGPSCLTGTQTQFIFEGAIEAVAV